MDINQGPISKIYFSIAKDTQRQDRILLEKVLASKLCSLKKEKKASMIDCNTVFKTI